MLYNLRFADDIDLLGGSEEELQQLTQRLEITAWKSARTKSKSSSTATSISTDEWKSVRISEMKISKNYYG